MSDTPDLDRIEWTGDLDDDCSAGWNELWAHAEGLNDTQWYCAVGRKGTRQPFFHSAEASVLPLGGEAARKLCELVMQADHYLALARHQAAEIAMLNAEVDRLEARIESIVDRQT